MSAALDDSLDWSDATVVSRAGVDVNTRLKEVSEVLSCSCGSLSMTGALRAAGPVSTASMWPSSL
ncbi:hypothetical protein [Streptomyces sp. NPDC001966]